ncbi:27787_t:CDS:2 [Gigaspora margarita]|uniref:27787_t:CDS:1 n=1 Tax=Gigaspora margarita TaxID=4874 RepID=A0ABN7UQ43_GIGMA|nr:27787_t:CDS:2 [Gigaspora margarita]
MLLSDECNLYCTDPSEKNGSSYNGYFSVPLETGYKLLLIDLSNNTQYGKHDKHALTFILQFMDSNVYINASSRFTISVFDPENVYLEENISSRFLQSIKKANNYEVLTGQTLRLYLSRNIRKIIIPNWKATMGFQPDYKIIPYLTSRPAVSRTQYDVGMIGIVVMTEFDTTTVETEQSSFGLLGGAWSIAIVIYKLLFGDDAIQPFGLTQKHGYFYEKSQKKITKLLPTFPLVQLPGTSNNIDDENRAEQLEKKISDLELFLRDYVVEVQQLDEIYKNIENAKDS